MRPQLSFFVAGEITIEILVQCEDCRRYHNGVEAVAVSFAVAMAAVKQGRLHLQACLLPDCAGIKAEIIAGERPVARRVAHAGNLAKDRQRVSCQTKPVERREPYAESELNPAQIAYAEENFPPPMPQISADAKKAAITTAKDFTQEDFKNVGAAKTQNEALIRHFDQPENFGRWFSIEFLFELGAGHHMNNRARDLREHYGPQGWYLDNRMQQLVKSGPMLSHYRLCKIEHAESLSAEQKAKKLHAAGFEVVGQQELPGVPAGGAGRTGV